MNFLVVGTNYKFSPIKIRERISFSKKRLLEALFLLKKNPVIKGIVILSTCNRVELYTSTQEPKIAITELQNFLCLFHKIERENIFPYLYLYKNKDAIGHLFSVSCGLDSLILGETQILGQVKSAFIEAKNAGFTDNYLDKVFSAAIAFAKRIHSQTEISKGKISIGSVAIDFIKEKLGNFVDKTVIIIGTGKVGELVLKYLENEKSRVIFVANRSFEKAKEFASKIGQTAIRFDKFPQFLRQADVIISATSSPHFIIKKETLEGIVLKKLIILDLAVPRDVDPMVRTIENVELFDLEDLSSIAQKNLERKKLTAEKIEKLISQEVNLLWQKLIALEPEEVLLH
ncbi:MAG: glutamyl-tRNA reductase [Candidatus Omnitrophica bacterium]|nr:glutamyl-tRNA reductase [Candidatus Omnitrophota bacterium]MCM8830961.1 glutamyl-tRNA reductase [Candidatus Omnitrophota bacterium]